MRLSSASKLILSLLVTLCDWKSVSSLGEIRHLTGNPDYRYVALNWEIDMDAPYVYGFQIRYCELQAWGPHRCKLKTVENDSITNMVSKTRQSRLYSVIVPGLRMATNYSFEVRPITTKRMDREFQNLLPNTVVVVSTKGFSAKASLCLPQESEIEVSTGPYFAGRIAVEAADGERCAVDGDPNSPRDIYTLRINHSVCGSKVNETTVSTFVLVQENLPILTHSTRRFLVLCTYQPDTLTVRAKINLPSGLDENHRGNSVDMDETHVEDEDLDFRLGDDIRVMRLQQSPQNVVDVKANEIARVEPISQFVLMLVLIAAGVGGFMVIVWWSFQQARKRSKVDEASCYSDESIREPSEINFEIESVCGIRNNNFFPENCDNPSSSNEEIYRKSVLNHVARMSSNSMHQHI